MSELGIAIAVALLIGGGVFIASRSGGTTTTIIDGTPVEKPKADPFQFDLSALIDLSRRVIPSGFAQEPDPAPAPQPDTGFVPGGGVLVPDPAPSDPFASYKNLPRDVDILARTLWGEARGESKRGREAVASVIMNRAADRRWPSTPAEVCLQPWQFSMWNPGEPNRAKALAVGPLNIVFRECVDIAKSAVAGHLPDRTGGANHYHTHAVDPSWNRGMRKTASIGGHVFFVG